MPLVDDLHNTRRMIEMSDDFAYSNGSIARIDAEIARVSIMDPVDQLLDTQHRQGKLSVDQQRAHLAHGMIVKIYDPTNDRAPWRAGRIIRFFAPHPTGLTIEDRNGVLHSAPFGDRIRLVGSTIVPPRVVAGLSCGDLFAPL